MPPQALVDWQNVRAARIQELLDAHRQVGGSGQGRRWRTTQLNWALTLRVAAEFQGFARSLHDLAASEILTRTAQLNFPVGTTLQRILTNGRDLDRGNPGPGALGRDFGMLGMNFWPELRQRVRSWHSWMTQLARMTDSTVGQYVGRVFGGAAPW